MCLPRPTVVVQCRAALRFMRLKASSCRGDDWLMFAHSNHTTPKLRTANTACSFSRTALLLAVLAVVVCTMFVPATASACPMCKVALASHDPHSGDMVSGYFYSILFMMS